MPTHRKFRTVSDFAHDAGRNAMQDGEMGNKNRVLTSWKEIANYLGKGVRTVQRWEKDFGLPIRRPIGSDKSAILARTRDLDAWIAMRCSPRKLADGDDSANHRLSAIRSYLRANLATAQILHESNVALLAELRIAVAELQQSIQKIRNRPPSPFDARAATHARTLVLTRDKSHGADAA
jgi:predicted DNA-binding transcriptional regulator AlpA